MEGKERERLSQFHSLVSHLDTIPEGIVSLIEEKKNGFSDLIQSLKQGKEREKE